MVARAILAALMVAGLASLSGCGPARLDQTSKFTIDAHGTPGHTIELSAQPQPQAITVEFESSTTEVTAALFKAGEEVYPEKINLSKAIKGEKGKSGKFTADVPANTATQIMVGEASKSTEVKLHITNRK
jgi:hypothetical protein